MSSFKASAINPRMAGALTRSLYAAGFSLAVSTLSTQAYAGCQYVIDSQWNNGFAAKIKITNDGASAINGWNISWRYSGDNRITSSYNAVFSGTNPYSAGNLSWNGSIAVGQSVEFGFQGTKGAAAAEIPEISGAACSGGTATSSAAPSSNAASSVSVIPSSVAASSTATTSSVNNGGGVLFSDTFESGTVNTQPAGWQNFIGWVPNNSNTASGAQFALVDSTKAYTGTKSVRFKGGQAPAQLVRALPAGTQRLYTRAYVNMSVPMGNVAGDNHEHIFGIKKTFDANDEIRVGQIKGVLGTNHIPSDNIAPKQSQWWSGPQMAANTWYCVEVDYLADEAYDTLRMRVNGNEVHSITSSADWNNGALAANWMSDKFNYVMFGFHSFSGRSADVWMDDIVVSTQPIGCGTTPPPASSSSVASVAPSSSSKSSVAPSSVPASSVAPSSVPASSVAPSSSSRSSSSAATTAAWTLNTTDSYLNFVTTKNTHNVEVHSFTGLAGDISSAGVATLTIDLNSVNTGVALRDQRMKDLLFETATYPTATVTVTVPATVISSLAVGQSAATDISATLDLHGVTGTITTKVSVQKLSNSRILVQTLAPVLVKAGDYSLTNGVEALRAAVNIASISVAVPVDFALVFDAR